MSPAQNNYYAMVTYSGFFQHESRKMSTGSQQKSREETIDTLLSTLKLRIIT